MNYYTLLISIIFVWFSPCNGGIFKSIFLPPGSTKLDELDMKMGDIIECGGHILLATDPGIVIHVVGDERRGHIAEEHVSALSSQNLKCDNKGPGPRGAWESVQLARWQKSYFESLGRDFFYEFYTCNCEHWLNVWTGRSSGSLKTFLATSPDCEVLRLTREYFESVTDCWWTGCQLDSWAVKGCTQYGRWERAAQNCDGGRKYHCCAN